MSRKHKKTTKKTSLLLAIVLLIFVVLASCHNQSSNKDTPIVIPPAYEEQFYNVSYNECSYILNKNTHKFHYKHCYTIDLMSQNSKVYCDDSRESIVNHNYTPCMKCKP